MGNIRRAWPTLNDRHRHARKISRKAIVTCLAVNICEEKFNLSAKLISILFWLFSRNISSYIYSNFSQKRYRVSRKVADVAGRCLSTTFLTYDVSRLGSVVTRLRFSEFILIPPSIFVKMLLETRLFLLLESLPGSIITEFVCG